MSSLEIPKHPIPASEIPQYTDDIVINSLGSPVGFNDDQILYNANRIDQIRRLGGFGTITIASYSGEQAQLNLDTLLLRNGQAAAVGSSSTTKAPLQRSTHEPVEDRLDCYYQRPSVTIMINRSELDRQADIHWRKDVRGALDPQTRAVIINKAVKAGLGEQLAPRLLQKEVYLGLMALWTGVYVAMANVYTDNHAEAALMSVGTIQLYNAVHHMSEARSKGYAWGDRLKSLLPVAASDRYLAAQALLKTTRLVTAREIPR